jgi:hypothetical protein
VPKRLRAVELLRRKPVWIAPIAIGVVPIGEAEERMNRGASYARPWSA